MFVLDSVLFKMVRQCICNYILVTIYMFGVVVEAGYVIESGEVTYTSQYRIHTENTSSSYHQDPKQKIETHIPGVGRHTRYPRDSDDHTVRPRPKDQQTYPESQGITSTLDYDGHLRPRTSRTNTTEQPNTRSTITSLIHSHSYHSLDTHHRSLNNHFPFITRGTFMY